MVAQSWGHAGKIGPMATVQGRYFGQELEKRRKAAGISIPQMANRLQVDQSTVNRWEGGARKPDDTHLTMYLTECGATPEQIEMFKVRNSTTFDPVWGTLGATTDRASVVGALVRADDRATKLTIMASSSYPALLQTSGYAKFAMMRDGVAEDEISARVAERMGRVTMWRERTNPLEFDVLMDEAVLIRSAGNVGATLAQIKHLYNLSSLAHVNIQVVPLSAGWSAMQYGQFSIYEFAEDPAVAFLELRKVMIFFNDAEDVDGTYRASIDLVRPLAMSPEESRGFMLKKIEKLENLL
jgi:hypothetical protein